MIFHNEKLLLVSSQPPAWGGDGEEMMMCPKFHGKYKPKAEISVPWSPLLSAFPVKSPKKYEKTAFPLTDVERKGMMRNVHTLGSLHGESF